MATELTIVDLPDPYERDTANTPVDPGFVAADVAGNTFRNSGRELVLVENPSAGALLISVSSQPASRTGRLGDITNASIPANTTMAFQVFPPDGWASGGLTTITAASAVLLLAVVRGQLQGAG